MAKSIKFQDKLLPIMTVALIGAAFFLGNLWGKVQVYEGGKAPTKGAANQGDAGQNGAPAPEQAGPLSDDLWKEVMSDPVYAFGEEDAQVTLVEFTDYQCPFCKRYFDQTSSQIIDDYVNSGKVRYMFKDLPLSFHQNAKPASLAARCAGDQDKYLEMHDALFNGQEEWSNMADPASTFKGYAANLGLNQGNFDACYDNDTYSEEIDANIELAQRAGASGTPTFFINGNKVVGAQPYTAFQSAIDAEL